jgi:nicotinamide/nicotinate riboside kinase
MTTPFFPLSSALEMDAWLVIGISGVTCGGKTTLAQSLLDHFRKSHSKMIKDHIKIKNVVLMNQDDYFLPVDSPTHTLVEKLNHINWEVISAIDMDRMCGDILNVLGEKFLLYNTDAESGTKMDEEENLFSDHHINFSLAQKKYQRLNTHPYINLNILILEGFLLFNHSFTLDLCTLKFHLHIPYERCAKRRAARTYDPPDVVGYFEMIVWPTYEKNIKELKDVDGMVLLNGDLSQEQIFKFVLKSIENAL